MKKLLLLLLFLSSVQFVNADCSSFGMTFYPLEENINRDSMFIIEGYFYGIQTVESFRIRKVYLQSESGALIELKLQEILYSQMHLAQAIFKPSKTLQPNTKYTIKYEEQTQNETSAMLVRNGKERKQKSWMTTTVKHSKPFSTTVSATYNTSIVDYYGCGPAPFAIFDVKNDPSKQTWYKAELLELATNTTYTYYIRSNESKLRVGHGMCSGAFSFARKGTYKVRFTPVNSDGKLAKTTNWIAFKSPYESSKTRGF